MRVPRLLALLALALPAPAPAQHLKAVLAHPSEATAAHGTASWSADVATLADRADDRRNAAAPGAAAGPGLRPAPTAAWPEAINLLLSLLAAFLCMSAAVSVVDLAFGRAHRVRVR